MSFAQPGPAGRAVQVLQHPWVSGAAWQALLPDLSHTPEPSPYQALEDSRSFNAEVRDVAHAHIAGHRIAPRFVAA